MRITVFSLIGLLFIIIQTSLFQGLPEWMGMPDLLFILIVFAAIHLRIVEGVILCFVLGTAMEVFSGYFLGLYILSYCLTLLLIRAVSSRLIIKEVVQQPAITALAYLLSSGLVYVFSSMLAEGELSPWGWGRILQRVLIVTILAIPFNRIFHLVMKQCEKKYEKRSFFTKKYGTDNRYRPDKSRISHP
jgi:rod shape-determining protein MreD